MLAPVQRSPSSEALPLSNRLACSRCAQFQQASLRRYECSDGSVQVRWQCSVCGCGIGSALARARLPCRLDELPGWDAALSDAHELKRKEFIEESQRTKVQELERMRLKYREYLSSPAWRSRRQAVLDREGGLCQGCRAADAVEVHHLTYAHIRAEMLFELVALCRSCHERIHGISAPWALDGE